MTSQPTEKPGAEVPPSYPGAGEEVQGVEPERAGSSAEAGQGPAGEGAQPAATRVFVYADLNGQRHAWDDPGPTYSAEDVCRQLQAHFPDLARAEVTERDLPDGRREVCFVKRAGTKGLTGAEMARALTDLPEPQLRGVALVWELDRCGFDPLRLVQAQGEIAAALVELEAYQSQVEEVRHRWTKLTPIPSRRVPPGF